MQPISKSLRQLLHFPRIRVMHIAPPTHAPCSLLPRLSRRGEKSPTKRVIESAKGKMKRAMMIYLIRGISEWNCVCTCDIVRYIRGIHIFKKKGKREREGEIEFYSRQHKPRRSYPIPVKRFCKKARCIKKYFASTNKLLLTKCVIMFHEFHTSSNLNPIQLLPASSQSRVEINNLRLSTWNNSSPQWNIEYNSTWSATNTNISRVTKNTTPYISLSCVDR